MVSTDTDIVLWTFLT